MRGSIPSSEGLHVSTLITLSRKLSFMIEEEGKSFPDKQKQRELMTTKTARLKTVEGILQTAKKDRHIHEVSRKSKLH